MSHSAKGIKSAAGVGLAFVTGIAVFAATFAVVDYFRGRSSRFLIPLADRGPAGPMVMPMLGMDPEKTPADWSLESQRGKVVVVNYFATWCPACIDEMPDMVKLANEFKPRGVEFVAVSLDKDDEMALGTPRETVLRIFTKMRGIPFPILLPAKESTIWKQSVPLPQTFVFDKQGRRAQFIPGEIDADDLRKALEALINEKS